MPSINTVAMRPIWLLEDLYVAPAGRRKGVATALMTYAENFARETGAERLTLATAHDNRRAQSLYKRMGYVQRRALLVLPPNAGLACRSHQKGGVLPSLSNRLRPGFGEARMSAFARTRPTGRAPLRAVN